MSGVMKFGHHDLNRMTFFFFSFAILLFVSLKFHAEGKSLE